MNVKHDAIGDEKREQITPKLVLQVLPCSCPTPTKINKYKLVTMKN